MSRPLRIEFPGAWYHVMNRGRRSESIFSDNQDYSAFVDLLIELSAIWNVNIAAYCLMKNHYHVLLQTPEGNLSRCMRHLNGLYTQRYNRRFGLDGQLFKGRYKSLLVCDDSHLLQLVRYIHKNPVKAGIANRISDYKWSSYKGYLSYSKKWDWLYKDFIFDMITKKKQGRLKPFVAFMEGADSREVEALFALKKLPSIFGPDAFVTSIKEKYYFKKKNYEVPQSKALAPEPDEIISSVCEYYKVPLSHILKTRRGVFNEPRNVTVYLLRYVRGEDLKSIGRLLNINCYSTVSNIVQRIKKLNKMDRTIRNNIKAINKMIISTKSKHDLFD